MGAGEKTEQKIVGFALGEAMQVDAAVNRQSAAGQLSNHRLFNRMRPGLGRRIQALEPVAGARSWSPVRSAVREAPRRQTIHRPRPACREKASTVRGNTGPDDPVLVAEPGLVIAHDRPAFAKADPVGGRIANRASALIRPGLFTGAGPEAGKQIAPHRSGDCRSRVLGDHQPGKWPLCIKILKRGRRNKVGVPKLWDAGGPRKRTPGGGGPPPPNGGEKKKNPWGGGGRATGPSRSPRHRLP